MIDISFGKIVIVAAVALIVIGPERLPQVARTAGVLISRMQRYIAGIKNELHHEIEKVEFTQLEAEFRATSDKIERALLDIPSSSRQNGPVCDSQPPNPAKKTQLDLFEDPSYRPYSLREHQDRR